MDQNKLYDYLLKHYGVNEPIICSNLKLKEGYGDKVQKELRALCNKGKLKHYSRGIYYIPLHTPLGLSNISPTKITERKYISDKDNNEVYGYYAGFSLLYSWGLTTQVPAVLQIVSNKVLSSRERTIVIGCQEIRVWKPRVEVTIENWRVLQLLELMSDPFILQLDEERIEELLVVVMKLNYKWNEVRKYVDFFPDVVCKALILTGVYDKIRNNRR